MKRLLLLTPVLVGLVVVLVVRDSGTGGGPLDSTPAGHASPMLVGEQYDHFSVLLFNRGEQPIELDRV